MSQQALIAIREHDANLVACAALRHMLRTISGGHAGEGEIAQLLDDAIRDGGAHAVGAAVAVVTGAIVAHATTRPGDLRALWVKSVTHLATLERGVQA